LALEICQASPEMAEDAVSCEPVSPHPLPGSRIKTGKIQAHTVACDENHVISVSCRLSAAAEQGRM
jgi:hypothetical protein